MTMERGVGNVLVASNRLDAGMSMLVHVVHGLEELVGLLSGRIKLQPLSVGRQADALC
jgi:hypothetical protein